MADKDVIKMWTDKDMLDFARISTEGPYGDYSGCRTIESKLSRYKKIQKEMINSGKEWNWMDNYPNNYLKLKKEEKEKKIVELAEEISFRLLATKKHPEHKWLIKKLSKVIKSLEDK